MQSTSSIPFAQNGLDIPSLADKHVHMSCGSCGHGSNSSPKLGTATCNDYKHDKPGLFVLFYCFKGNLLSTCGNSKSSNFRLPAAMAHMNEEQLGHISVPRPNDLVEKPSVVKWSLFFAQVSRGRSRFAIKKRVPFH